MLNQCSPRGNQVANMLEHTQMKRFLSGRVQPILSTQTQLCLFTQVTNVASQEDPSNLTIPRWMWVLAVSKQLTVKTDNEIKAHPETTHKTPPVHVENTTKNFVSKHPGERDTTSCSPVVVFFSCFLQPFTDTQCAGWMTLESQDTESARER